MTLTINAKEKYEKIKGQEQSNLSDILHTIDIKHCHKGFLCFPFPYAGFSVTFKVPDSFGETSGSSDLLIIII